MRVTPQGDHRTKPKNKQRECAIANIRSGWAAPHRAIAWYSSFGRMSTAATTRFDMLKKAAVEAMSQMSQSEKPASRNAVGLDELARLLSQLHREFEHRLLFRGKVGGAEVHHHDLAKGRVAVKLAHRRAMGGDAAVSND